MTFTPEKLIIVTGHYGCGKTNLAVNMALDFRKKGEKVTLVDIDIVNPYFRSADFMQLAKDNDFHLVVPPSANTNVDVPCLSGEVDGAIMDRSSTVILDVGGDDAGAAALGRYTRIIKERGYTMLYVVNAYRYLTQTPEDAVEVLMGIEAKSRLRATHIVNNSHLCQYTTVSDVEKSHAYAQAVAEETKLPLGFTTLNKALIQSEVEQREYYPVEIYVKTPWDNLS